MNKLQRSVIHQNIERIWAAVNELRIASETYLMADVSESEARLTDNELHSALSEISEACKFVASRIRIVVPEVTETKQDA